MTNYFLFYKKLAKSKQVALSRYYYISVYSFMYTSYWSLIKQECEGKDFRIRAVKRESPVCVVVPHGGNIEPGTSKIGRLLAGDTFSFYAFEGIKKRNNATLHIPSTWFDEPLCLELVKDAELVITVHGCKECKRIIRIGGRHQRIKRELIDALGAAGLPVEGACSLLAGTHQSNICNRGKGGRGVQFEISAGIRGPVVKESLKDEEENLLSTFIGAVRDVIQAEVFQS